MGGAAYAEQLPNMPTQVNTVAPNKVSYWGAIPIVPPVASVPTKEHHDVTGAPTQEQKNSTKLKKRVRDTGTEGNAGVRYARIKEAIRAGKLKPSFRAIKNVEGGSNEVIAGYLAQLEKEGVVVKDGRGWKAI
jgi:hypothetical protein